MTEIKVTKHDNATVTLAGEIPAASLEKHRSASIQKLGTAVKLDGFREGHAPEHLVAERIGEGAILEEMANRALSEHYPQLLIEHQIDAIGRPDVTVTKLAAGNPLGFKITTAVLPSFDLPEYKELAKDTLAKEKSGPEAVADADIDLVIEDLLKEKQKAAKEGEKIEMTDDIAKTFGQFENVAALRAKIKEGMEVDKKRQYIEKRRTAVLEAILAKTKITLPEILIDAELNKLMGQFLYDIERMGFKKDDYLAAIKKTEADLQKDFRPDAEKRAKIQLILNRIALTESIKPETADIKKEVEHLLSHHEHHEGHDEARERESATIYVTTLMTNQLVLEFLENQA